jgi:hypothetical protein
MLRPLSKKFPLIIILFCLFTACVQAGKLITPAPSPPLNQISLAQLSVDQLVDLLEASDPASPLYAPFSSAYEEFPQVLHALAAANASTNSVASMLAYAIRFPRPDSILAASAVISLGPDWAATTLPILIDNLKSHRPEIRAASNIVLSSIGDKASCSLGNIGPLLWDDDAQVRTSAALAIKGITGQDLVDEEYTLNFDDTSFRIIPDDPEGSIVTQARNWWFNTGSKVNWHPSYDLCDP